MGQLMSREEAQRQGWRIYAHDGWWFLVRKDGAELSLTKHIVNYDWVWDAVIRNQLFNEFETVNEA